MSSKVFCTLIQVMLTSVIAVHAVPAPYCLYPLNKTDCGGAPTPVFSYYKSGSRCEIEIWRGCPSYNRFDSQTSCSHYCIARFHFEENEILDDEPCEGKLNSGNCGEEAITVYTYDQKNDTCKAATWRGCKTSNKFYSMGSCRKECVHNTGVWEDTVKKMEDKDIEVMNKLVDGILEEGPAKLSDDDNVEESHVKLKNVQDAPAVVTTVEPEPEPVVETTTMESDMVEEVDNVRL